MNRLIQRKTTAPPLIALALLGFALLPKAQAVVPPPDGGYPGFNTAEGTKALQNLTTGVGNTATGWYSLFGNSSTSFNTGVGAGTLVMNNADSNTAIGVAALLFNTSGAKNTAVGVAALLNNTTATANTATGAFALSDNTSGSANTANGFAALESNTEGGNNTANGQSALLFNTTGNQNTAIGSGALFANNDDMNTGVGFQSLFSNTTGFGNTAVGGHALAAINGSENTAVGLEALSEATFGLTNTAIGYRAGLNVTDAYDVICIGANVYGANVAGSCFIGQIRGRTTQNNDAIPVLIDSDGQLGTISSSRRFKKDITAMDQASEAVLVLKPVTFHYKSDGTNRPEFGLIAEEVAEVNPDLVVHDEKGEIYTVRYDAVNAMLLNEFLKEHRKVEQMEKQIEVLAAGLQKVSAQLELNKPAPQTALNDERE